MPEEVRQLQFFENRQQSRTKIGEGGAFKLLGCSQFHGSYNDIISIENLLLAWGEFAKGKRNKRDVQNFQIRLMDNILNLHSELLTKIYVHGGYEAFRICDPKPRHIHKASVRDRLLHHAIYRVLYPFFDRLFSADSFSCRVNKGTHRAINRFKEFGRIVSKNNTYTCWVLKCDIRKFFASINQPILLDIVRKYIDDQDIVWLLKQVIISFHNTSSGKGLPLGNLTSQLLVNIYMNKFDQFMKHAVKVKHYIRYADDFVLLSQDRLWLENLIPVIGDYLFKELRLNLHPNKVYIKTMSSGVDFLGWVHFADHRVLRTATKLRMFRHLTESNRRSAVVASYLGLLSHGNTWKLRQSIEKMCSHKPHLSNKI